MFQLFPTGSYVYDMNTIDASQGRGVILESRRGNREFLICWANGRRKWTRHADLSTSNPANAHV